MRKFLIKAKIQLLVLVLVVISMIIIAGNVSLALKKDAIEQMVDGYFTYKISVGPLFYLFPNRILFSHVLIEDKDRASENLSFILPKMTMRFGFWELLFKNTFNVYKVTLYPSRIRYAALDQFLKENFQTILEIIRNSSGNDMVIHLKESRLDLNRGERSDSIAAEIFMSVKGDIAQGTGFFRADQYQFSERGEGGARHVNRGWPLWYRFESRFDADSLDIDELVFKSSVLHAKLWGGMDSGRIKVNGFALMNTAKKELNKDEYSSSRYLENFPDGEELSNIDTYILDIAGVIHMEYPDVIVEKLNFAFNNVPVILRGSLSLSPFLAVDTTMSLLGGRSSGKKNPFFEKIDMVLSGAWKGDALHTDGQAKIAFIDQGELSLLPKKAEVDLHDLSFYLDRFQRPHVDLAGGNVVYWTNKKEHRLSVENVKMAANIKTEGLKVIEVDAPFYEGSLNGTVWIDSLQSPSKITSNIILTDVDTDALEGLMVHFAKFNGRMSSKINFTNVPDLSMTGDIAIYNGTLTNFAFFNWLSDSFRLPDLRAIDFGKASALFSIDKERAQLSSIHLKTEDVHVSGYFGVDAKDLVYSKLSLALSQVLLRRSPEFKPILKMFSEDGALLGFDFQLSGKLNAMNFQWLPSDVKQKIQDRVPDFIERMIERNVDGLLEVKEGKSR